jgi:hypothetical protein
MTLLNVVLDFAFPDRRFNTDIGSSRIVHAPTVRIAEQPVNGINPQDVADALSSSGGKGKKLKAYRRSDAHFFYVDY